MAIKELTKQDILVIESMTKNFSSEIWNLKKKFKDDATKNDLFAPLYNFKDLVSLRLFDYYMPLKSTDKIREILDKIYTVAEPKTDDEIAAENDQKDDIILLISSAMGVHNSRFKDASSAEDKQKGLALFTEHFKSYVWGSKNSFTYQNQFGKNKKDKFVKKNSTLKDAEKNVIGESSSQLGYSKDKPDEKTTFINEEILLIADGAFKKIFTTLTEDYLSVYSSDLGIDLRISVKDLTPFIKSGKVKVFDGVEVIKVTAESKADPAPVATKPAQIEQPKPAAPAKPATPVAQAQPTPAPEAKPAEPAVDKRAEAEAFLASVAVSKASEETTVYAEEDELDGVDDDNDEQNYQ